MGCMFIQKDFSTNGFWQNKIINLQQNDVVFLPNSMLKNKEERDLSTKYTT